MGYIELPIFTKNEDGSLAPNYAFHRPSDKVHSRCIEYPWAASNFNGENSILDVGSAKADSLWLQWLKSNKKEPYFTDYDLPSSNSCYLNKFIRSDIRSTPFDNNNFDVIFAISVIEHIGLNNPQSFSQNIPKTDIYGDVIAFRELIRILRPSGRLLMTLPISNYFRLDFNSSARMYTAETLSRFSSARSFLSHIEFYEYSPQNKLPLYWNLLPSKFIRKLCLDFPGPATWKKVSPGLISSRQHWHTDCVALGIWSKY